MDLQSIINSFKSYIFYGTLGQKNGDLGDSSQRVGLFYSLAGLLSSKMGFTGLSLGREWSTIAPLHEASKGLYRRNPNLSDWGSNPNNFSRDQHSILMIGMAVMEDKKRLLQSLLGFIKRLGFHQNYYIGTNATGIWYKDYRIPDILVPSEISVFIRGMNLWLLKPLLYLLDSTFLLDLYFRKNNPWDYDNMLAINILYANSKYPTFVSRYVMRKYLSTNFMSLIKNYYSESNGANGLVPLGEVYELAFKQLTDYKS